MFLLDLSPLRRHRDYRLLYLGQTLSFVGSMLSYVALPYQVFELTQSSLWVGMLGSVQLVPLLVAGLFGGALADAVDRRRMLVVCELVLALAAAGLVVNALLPHPSVIALFVLSALMSGVNGFHRPALDALSFGVSVLRLAGLRGVAKPEAEPASSLSRIAEGLRFARARPELVGTYVVDIVAMTFAMPMALFPNMGQRWGGASAVGWLYSAMAIGSLLMTLFSGWTSRVRRQGAAVVWAAALWGVAIVALGVAPTLPLAVTCLALAGAADMVSGLFRMTIWNQTIPDSLRGRLAGVEMISYMAGPLLGNARAGFVAESFGDAVSILSGGLLCVLGVLGCVPLLPGFVRYEKTESSPLSGT